MLKKLLKYDLRNVFKILSVFYLLALFFSILTRIFLGIDNSLVFNIIGKICSGTFITMVIDILLNNVIRLLVTFRGSLYGDESYLTHTLPVDKTTLYLSKVICSFLTVLGSFLVIGITLFIAYYSKENLELLKGLLYGMGDSTGSITISLLLVTLGLIFLQFINILQIGYTGIILGHRKNTNKIFNSIWIGFVSYIGLQLLVFGTLFGSALFNKDIMNLFTTNMITDISYLKILLYVGIGAYVVLYIVNYFINVRFFKKGVNVD